MSSTFITYLLVKGHILTIHYFVIDLKDEMFMFYSFSFILTINRNRIFETFTVYRVGGGVVKKKGLVLF